MIMQMRIVSISHSLNFRSCVSSTCQTRPLPVMDHGEDVYALFGEQLQLAQQGELVGVLDEQDGLIARWSAICDQK